jgi:hypothetical protein
VLVGHVTKEGTLAGPRVLEHMVDATLYFEGDRGHQFRILRAVKNRFGATDEIGVFEMTDRGLVEVANPSALFLAERRGNVSGSAVFAGIEGTRPVLVEVQALLAPSAGGSPRRSVVGWDAGRLSMLLAVLESRCGLSLGANDVYLNIAGRPPHRRAGGRPRRGGGAGVRGHRPADGRRDGLLRRGRLVRRSAAGGARGGAAPGSPEARLRRRRAAEALGARRTASGGAGRAAPDRDGALGRLGRAFAEKTVRREGARAAKSA